MIVFKNKGYQTNNLYPITDWTGTAEYIVEDGTELAIRIMKLYPYYDFVLGKKGQLVDVVATERPPKPLEEKQAEYDRLSIKYIHEKYSYDDENKIIREYLSDQSNAGYKAAFETYNAYVSECRVKAKKKVYGN